MTVIQAPKSISLRVRGSTINVTLPIGTVRRDEELLEATMPSVERVSTGNVMLGMSLRRAWPSMIPKLFVICSHALWLDLRRPQSSPGEPITNVTKAAVTKPMDTYNENGWCIEILHLHEDITLVTVVL